MTTTIRITDPVDLVKVVPYQLGYHPQRSLVLIGLRRKQVGLVQRLDLPTLPRDCAAAADLLVGHLKQDGCTGAVVVVYEECEGAGALAAAAMVARLQAGRFDVVEHVVVRDGAVFFGSSPGLADRPVTGVLLPPDDQVPVVADYVARGRRPAPSRGALDERIAPVDGPLRERVRVAAVRLGALRPVRSKRRQALTDWGAFLDVRDDAWFAGTLPSAAATARMCHSLRDLQLRDLVTSWLCPGTLELTAFEDDLRELALAHLPRGRAWTPPSDSADTMGQASTRPGGRRAVNDLATPPIDEDERLIERLCWLARHTPDVHAAAVLSVLASLTWHLGDGTLTRIALDRALALDPGYRLALLIERMLDLAIRPGRVLSSTG
jgi:hypothetical protein